MLEKITFIYLVIAYAVFGFGAVIVAMAERGKREKLFFISAFVLVPLYCIYTLTRFIFGI